MHAPPPQTNSLVCTMHDFAPVREQARVQVAAGARERAAILAEDQERA